MLKSFYDVLVFVFSIFYSSTMLCTPPPPSSLRGGLKILEEPLLGEGEGGVGIRNFYLGEGDILSGGANFVGGVT